MPYESIFTLEATPVKFGPGAAADAGWELKRLGVTRALLVTDPRVAALSGLSLVLFALGYPEQARTRIHAGLTLAQHLAHPHHLVWGQHMGAIFYQLCRQEGAMRELADAVVTSAREQGVLRAAVGFATAWVVRWQCTVRSRPEPA